MMQNYKGGFSAIIAAVLAASLLVGVCDKAYAQSAGKGGINARQWLPLAMKYWGEDITFWDDTVTVSDAAGAGDVLARGKTNIKISGALTDAQLSEIIEILAKKEKVLFRLDLSETTGLRNIKGCANLGALAVPERVREISGFSSSALMEVNLPGSIRVIRACSHYCTKKGSVL